MGEREGTGLSIKIVPLVIAFGLILNSLKSKSQPQSALLFCPGAQLHKLSLLLTYAQYMSIIKCSRTIAILLESLRSQRKKSPNLLASQRMARGLYQKSHSSFSKNTSRDPKPWLARAGMLWLEREFSVSKFLRFLFHRMIKECRPISDYIVMVFDN